MANIRAEHGLCECGCGQPTRIAKKTDRRNGCIKGQPKRFLVNHDKRHHGPDYSVEDRGYATPCWIWARGYTSAGYASLPNVPGKGQMLAHRFYYEQAKGAIPRGLHIDHLCRQKLCVNPEHLEAVTQAENNRRAVAIHQNRHARHLTDEQVRFIRKSDSLQAELSRRFGLSQSNISQIRNRKSYREVGD